MLRYSKSALNEVCWFCLFLLLLGNLVRYKTGYHMVSFNMILLHLKHFLLHSSFRLCDSRIGLCQRLWLCWDTFALMLVYFRLTCQPCFWNRSWWSSHLAERYAFLCASHCEVVLSVTSNKICLNTFWTHPHLQLRDLRDPLARFWKVHNYELWISLFIHCSFIYTQNLHHVFISYAWLTVWLRSYLSRNK